jgi:hypothetical protein
MCNKAENELYTPRAQGEKKQKTDWWRSSVTKYVPYLPVIPAKSWDNAMK